MSKSHFYIVETNFDVFYAHLIMYLSNIYMQIPKSALSYGKIIIGYAVG